MFKELAASQVLHGVLGGLRGRPDGGDYPLHMEQSTVHTTHTVKKDKQGEARAQERGAGAD